jgi:hypothetical protein
VHPPRRVDGRARGGLVLPVAEHHAVAAGAELPRRAAGRRLNTALGQATLGGRGAVSTDAGR